MDEKKSEVPHPSEKKQEQAAKDLTAMFSDEKDEDFDPTLTGRWMYSPQPQAPFFNEHEEEWDDDEISHQEIFSSLTASITQETKQSFSVLSLSDELEAFAEKRTQESESVEPFSPSAPSFRKEVEALQEKLHWKVGAVVDGKYEVKGVVGRGGMGIVYNVRHREWDVELAVKMPLSYSEASEIFKARFIREAQIWVNLGMHPNIVQCWYVRELGGIPCVFMDYISGGSLKDWIKAKKIQPGEWGKILDFIIQACDGLGYAYQNGVAAHRDVKPGNLLLSSDGRLHVTDFGIVRHQKEQDIETQSVTLPVGVAGLSMTITGSDLGTPEYSAPEQWGKAKEADPRSDIYALGGILFELCCGRRPFDDGKQREPAQVMIGRHLFMPPPDPRAFRTDVPADLANLILTCLQKDPEKRPASIAKLRQQCVEIYASAVGKPYERPEPQTTELRSNALNNRAVSLLDLGQKFEALAAFNEALKLDPHHPESVYNKALVEWRDRQINDEEVIRRLKEAKQASPRAGLYLANIYAEQAAADAAERELIETIEHGAVIPYSAIWRALGDAQMAQEKFAEASDSYEKALELLPDDQALQQRRSLVNQQNRSLDGQILFPWPHCLHTFVGEKSDVKSATLTPDGRLALLRYQHEFKLWDLTSGETLWTFIWNAAHEQWNCKGQANTTTSVGLTPDGKFLLSSHSKSSHLVLWELDTGRCLRTFTGHTDGINAIIMLPGGNHIISGSADMTLRLWDIRTGESLQEFRGHTNPVKSAAVTPDGQYLFSCGGESVRVWEVLTGKYLKRLAGKDRISVLAVSPDGQKIFAGCQDGLIRIYSWPLGRLLHSFSGHGSVVTMLAVSPDGRFVVSSSSDKTLRVWNVSTGKIAHLLKGHTAAVTSCALAKNGRLLISSSRDRTVRLWNMATGECIRVLQAFSHWMECVIPTPGENAIIIGNGEELRLLRLQDGQYVRSFVANAKESLSLTTHFAKLQVVEKTSKLLFQLTGDDFSFCWHEGGSAVMIPVSINGRFAIALSEKEKLCFSDLQTQALLEMFKGGSGLQSFRKHRNWMTVIVMTHDERLLISNWFDASVRVWDVQSTQEVRVLEGHQEIVTALAITSAGTHLVSGSADKTVRLWNLRTGECLRVFTGHDGQISTVAITPNARYILSGSLDKTLRVWDSATGICVRILSGHAESIAAAAMTDDGHIAFSAGKDKTFRIWAVDADAPRYLATLQVCRQQEHAELLLFKERYGKYIARADTAMNQGKIATAYTFLALARAVPGYERDPAALALNLKLGMQLQRKTLREGRLIRNIEGHTDFITSISVTPDGRFAVSGGRDRTVRVWTLANGTSLRELKGHRGSVSCVAVSPDRYFALSGSWDTTLRLWALATGECLKVFKDHEDYVRAVAITPDGRFAISGSTDTTLRLWYLSPGRHVQGFEGMIVPLEDAYREAELTTAKCLRVFRGHTSDVVAVAVSADGRYALSGSWDTSLRFWSLTNGKCLETLRGHTNYVTSVALSSDGRLALSGSRDGTIRFWSVARKKCVRVLHGHDGYVTSVAMTPDRRFAISGGWDHTIRVWQLSTGECLRVFERHTDAVEAISLTPDGHYLVSGGRDRIARYWEFDWRLAPGKHAEE
ncbi:serine/threonine protein kinase with WD40 repeats [Candidatus Moduliflexus flocculans]|uniref:Serine/threonine protein kinase with WD40 repeats n=1 Tax=Candidatus Moduliflexus flocculans TaxID=1499966 RepID=A0A0S6VX77_9BACT|nr:serine/threonine protein kinase with WD40 repeats [Candidatus Moduliflexus flocculans]